MLKIKRIALLATVLLGINALGHAQNNKTKDIEEALNFLYASMPLPDSVDYPRDFWTRNVECTMKAREEMRWGKTIPEREFKHFVLPVRVNNENLDEARMVFYEQLKPRLQGLSMEQAVLEVNHWCHERVTYTPSDERTSSPLATIRTAYGRCGEESTLLVAALRSVCIPARQVYTPRWAHTDDNHAWVEAWVNGKWHFLGACEPEAVLDLGWFNAPASRSMLMHTKAFGQYDGPEEVMDRTQCYTEIAVTQGYAPVVQRQVQVVDQQGNPVADASVEFKIYNYAEFYTFSTKNTDTKGLTSIQAGLGDLIVWAHKGEKYGFERLRMSEEGTLKVCLNHHPGETYSMDMEIVPPKERNTVPDMTDVQREKNAIRLVKEDSIRNSYVATFPSKELAIQWAKELKLPQERTADLMIASRGNYETISQYLGEYSNENALSLLESLSAKDLRDVHINVLKDHSRYGMNLAHPNWSDTTFLYYILCPRIANEKLTPFRGYLLANIPVSLQKNMKKGGVPTIIKWVNKNIKTIDESNPQSLRMLPEGVWKNRLTDSRSRDIFFVALCRTLGFPARIDGVTGKVQYMASEEEWKDVDFEKELQRKASSTGTLSIAWKPLEWNKDPKYYTHFTLSYIQEGTAQLLNYPEDTWSNTLRMPQTMDTGDYLLTSGTRMADGSVLVHLEVAPLKTNGNLVVPLTIREPKEGLQVIGSLNSEALYQPISIDNKTEGTTKSILSTTGRGYYVLGIIAPNNEPTNHTLRDIAAVKDELEAWGGHLVLLFKNQTDADRFNLSEFPTLPHNTHLGIDHTGAIYDELQRELRLKGTAPTFVIADTFNRVVFLSEGYTIGLGERLSRNLKHIKQ